MSLLKLAQEADFKRMPKYGFAKLIVKPTGQIKTSKAGNHFINIEFQGQGLYSKAKIFGILMLSQKEGSEWAKMGLNDAIRILTMSGKDVSRTFLADERTPAATPENFDKLVDLVEGQVALVRLRPKVLNGVETEYLDIKEILNPLSDEGKDALEKLGNADAWEDERVAVAEQPKTQTPASGSSSTIDF